MDLSIHLQKDKLHHAYLLEGVKENIWTDLSLYLEKIGIQKNGNPDFYELNYSTFKMADAVYLKSFTDKKSLSNNKKIFLISVDTILLEAQNTLLKLFEEPIADTHFFIVVPDTNALLPTFISRFYMIKSGEEGGDGILKARKFLSMGRVDRISFIQELLSEETIEKEEDMEDEEATVPSSSKSVKAQAFLNALEHELHQKYFIEKTRANDTSFLDHLFKTRMYLRQPGSSAKNLLESLALSIPEKL